MGFIVGVKKVKKNLGISTTIASWFSSGGASG
jgi:hypothetical protein